MQQLMMRFCVIIWEQIHNLTKQDPKELKSTLSNSYPDKKASIEESFNQVSHTCGGKKEKAIAKL